MNSESSDQNISDPTEQEWRNAKPYSAVPGPTGLPYVGRLYHYKLGGECPCTYWASVCWTAISLQVRRWVSAPVPTGLPLGGECPCTYWASVCRTAISLQVRRWVSAPVPGPTGLPYVGRLYHYKLGGAPVLGFHMSRLDDCFFGKAHPPAHTYMYSTHKTHHPPIHPSIQTHPPNNIYQCL